MATDSLKRRAAKQVLKEAADTEHFFDFSDSERLIWMLERAYEIGAEGRTPPAVRKNLGSGHNAHRKAGGT
jgi:hypothetical protein